MDEDRFKWQWERTNPDQSGSSGDITKLFRHEVSKAPGILRIDSPSATASVVAREVIQNSWDAARELHEADPDAPQFEIEFRFTELKGADKELLVNALDMRSLSRRRAAVDPHSVGLMAKDCLSSLDDLEDGLRVLQVVEHGSSGMYGPWDQNKSHMYLALVSIGYTEKHKGAGGSYGYGKAGLIKASKIRTVVAYSCFKEQENDVGVTRRLLGMTYWGQHDVDGVNYNGFSRFGKQFKGATRPYENEEADEVAKMLGMDVRRASEPRQLGTTFLVVDTPVDPGDLRRAVERWWWPALEENDFIVGFLDWDGSIHHPRPRRDPVLRSFIEGWEVATVHRKNVKGKAKFISLTRVDLRDDEGGDISFQSPGDLGLVAELEGWSYADQLVGPGDENRIEHKSLVALTRSPRMIVEYLEVGRTSPYVRGVFIADPEVDDLLRRTEPKGHDTWQTKSEDGAVRAEATDLASRIIERIKSNVSTFKKALKPPVPPPEDIHLPFFNTIMQRIMSGMGPGQLLPVQDTRPIAIRLSHSPVSAGSGLVRLKGKASFALSEHFNGDSTQLEVWILYRFLEDDRVGEQATLTVKVPEGFEELAQGRYRGYLTREREVKFEFQSEAYDSNWSGRLIVNGDPITPEVA